MTVTTRYLVLGALRWLPAGLMIPVTVLLAQQRGLSLAQIGMVTAVQGFVVLGLELPTGGLADTAGRRPVLLAAAVLHLASLLLLVGATSFWMFALVFALQGVFRALDSGPLDSWYVDAALAADPDARYEAGLSRSGVVAGCAIGGGALLAGGLVALDPFPAVSALTAPLVTAAALQAVTVLAIAVLLREPRTPTAHRPRLAATLRGVPAVIADAARLLRRSRVLAALVAVELFWAFGMMTFELLFPVRLAELIGSPDTAGTIMGPVGSVAWLASAAGAALVPMLVRRLGPARSGVTLQLGQALAVVAMGLFAGPAGAVMAFLVCYALHGAVNPVYKGLLHRQSHAGNRTTVASLASMAAQPAGAAGSIVLTSIADAAGVRTAILVGAIPLAVAAFFYLAARRTPPATAPGHSDEPAGTSGGPADTSSEPERAVGTPAAAMP
ncbi:MFS transporter [Catenuloplanes indicus]|uniref:MFS family permease n=1 Tax=Catenuloplanes indicus TaxID=137267 RepID=A0AAE3VY26_9ACTN|nr:MFS transporter [Catenuloplanes indicus]MDQ0365961.1 MFS family permease [Catenuloplanes indicus]